MRSRWRKTSSRGASNASTRRSNGPCACALSWPNSSPPWSAVAGVRRGPPSASGRARCSTGTWATSHATTAGPTTSRTPGARSTRPSSSSQSSTRSAPPSTSSASARPSPPSWPRRPAATAGSVPACSPPTSPLHSAPTSTSSSCWVWPRERCRGGGPRTCCCPTASGPRPVTTSASAVTASDEELADFRAALASRRATPPRPHLPRAPTRAGDASASRRAGCLPMSTPELIDSFQHGVASAEPASLTDYDLRDLLDWTERGGDPVDHVLAAELPNFGAGLVAAAVPCRHRVQQFRRPRRVRSHRPALDAKAAMSPTSLETYAVCPARYFYAKVLHIERAGATRGDPADRAHGQGLARARRPRQVRHRGHR